MSHFLTNTYESLVDALIPSTPKHAQTLGYEHTYGSTEKGIHDYLIYALDHYVSIQKQVYHTPVPLAYPTALLLGAGAKQLIALESIHVPQQTFSENESIFAKLTRKQRIRTLSLLENVQVDLYSMPSPFQNNAGLIKHVVDALNRLTLFGYYSEWSAYGTSRLQSPQNRKLECFPISWQQVGYPGVAYGYRDFRGFFMKIAREEETDDE